MPYLDSNPGSAAMGIAARSGPGTSCVFQRPPWRGPGGLHVGDKTMSGADVELAQDSPYAHLSKVAAVIAAALALTAAMPAVAGASAPPIVLIVLENHSLSQIRGDPADLPYQNALWSHTAPGVRPLDQPRPCETPAPVACPTELRPRRFPCPTDRRRIRFGRAHRRRSTATVIHTHRR